MADSDTYYTPQEVAEKLKVHERTVKKFLQNGQLHGVKVGSLWRIKASDLDKFLERPRTKGN